jgi:sugar lactone lactonase YvrE
MGNPQSRNTIEKAARNDPRKDNPKKENKRRSYDKNIDRVYSVSIPIEFESTGNPKELIPLVKEEQLYLLKNSKCLRFDTVEKNRMFVGRREKSPLMVLNMENGSVSPFSSEDFQDVNSIVIDSHGDVIIAERALHRIVTIKRKTKLMDHSTIISALLDPTAIAIDSKDVLYVADTSRILIIENKVEKYSIPNFSWVYGICLNPSNGDLYYNDYSSNSIGMYKRSELRAENPQPTNRTITLTTHHVTDIAVDKYGNVVGGDWHGAGKISKVRKRRNYSEDADNNTDKLDLNFFECLEIFPKQAFKNPTGVCYDPSGNLYFTEGETGQVWKVTLLLICGVEWAPFRDIFAAKLDKNSDLYLHSDGIPEVMNEIIFSLMNLFLC